MREIRVIAHDIRSIHNIGSLIRTADGFGVSKVYLTGYSPYPLQPNDIRLPHLTQKITNQIHKTALGAEKSVKCQHHQDIIKLIKALKDDGFAIVGLEQYDSSIPLPAFTPPEKIALLLGREVEGIEPELLKLCDNHIEIPMYGQKESFNVTQAAAVAMYALREA